MKNSFRSSRVGFLLLSMMASQVASAAEGPPSSLAAWQAVLATGGTSVTEVTRERLVNNIFHYGFTVRVGITANATIRLHRIVRECGPWQPCETEAGTMLLHGDFSSFATNFAPIVRRPGADPGMAVFLAQHAIDVWGVDRRWALVEQKATDLSDFATMGLKQELADISHAVTIARLVRMATGSGGERLHLVGFSRGGYLAYVAAAVDAIRPPAQRQVKGLVPLDIWAVVDPADTTTRELICEYAAYDRFVQEQGFIDSPNDFLMKVGQLALRKPNDVSPLNPPFTNREVMLGTAAQTWQFYSPAPRYHLAAGVIVDGAPTGLRESAESDISRWFADASPHQSNLEVTESDEAWCGTSTPAISYDLGRITVPLFFIGAAGGFGEKGLYTTTLVGSRDVTTRIIHRFGTDRVEQDFGHGDLLFARDAPALVWRPLAHWLARH